MLFLNAVYNFLLMKFWISFLVLVCTLSTLSSCSLFKKTVKKPEASVDSSFYENHSQLLGFPLSGNENPDLILEVASWIGSPYRFGGNTHAGTDCSGMVQQIFLTVYGIALPRNSNEIANYSKRVRKTQLQVGDLVFFETSSRRIINHVGIFLGSNKFIHSTTSRGVIVSDLDETYWNRKYTRAGRVL
jgi:hypothetical protein